MEILLYASAIIAALALVLIAVYVIIALKTVMKQANQITDLLTSTEKKVTAVTTRADTLMSKAESLTEDAQHKMDAFNGLTDAFGQLKASMHYMDESLQAVSERFNKQGEPNKAMRDTLKWGDTALSLFSKYKNYKNKQAAK